jgi:hypothetical protein
MEPKSSNEFYINNNFVKYYINKPNYKNSWNIFIRYQSNTN